MPFPLHPLRTLFDLQGEYALYTPKGASAPAAEPRVLYGQPIQSDAYGVGGTRISSRANVLHVLADDIAAPAEGDRFELVDRGVALVVQGQPGRGVRGQVWEVDTYEV